MSFKALSFSLGCALAWFVLLPMLVVGGGILLLAWAVLAEVSELLVGGSTPFDRAAVRESARRVCLNPDPH